MTMHITDTASVVSLNHRWPYIRTREESSSPMGRASAAQQPPRRWQRAGTRPPLAAARRIGSAIRTCLNLGRLGGLCKVWLSWNWKKLVRGLGLSFVTCGHWATFFDPGFLAQRIFCSENNRRTPRSAVDPAPSAAPLPLFPHPPQPNFSNKLSRVP